MSYWVLGKLFILEQIAFINRLTYNNIYIFILVFMFLCRIGEEIISRRVSCDCNVQNMRKFLTFIYLPSLDALNFCTFSTNFSPSFKRVVELCSGKCIYEI